MTTTKTISIDFTLVSERMEDIQKHSVFEEILKTEPGFSGSRICVPLSRERQAIAQSLARELIELLVVCQYHGKRSAKENRETFRFLYKRWAVLRLGKLDAWSYLVSMFSENGLDRASAHQVMNFSSFYAWLFSVEKKLSS